MNTLHLTLLSLVCATAVSSCVAPSPSIAQYGPGSDAAYLNGTRGAPEAQISEQQALQYRRQQDIVAREMQLEMLKRERMWQTLGGIARVAGAFAGVR